MHNRFYTLAAPLLYTAIFFCGYCAALLFMPQNHAYAYDTLGLLAALAVVPILILFGWLALKLKTEESRQRSSARPFLHLEAVTSPKDKGLLLVLSNYGQEEAQRIRLSDMAHNPVPLLSALPTQLPGGSQHIVLAQAPQHNQELQLMAEYQDADGNPCSNTLHLTLPAMPQTPLMY